MPAAYREDLAYIHDSGYGQLARDAAGRIVAELRAAGFPGGTVVDLGCGSGILAREVCRAGYRVTGIDVSAAMVAMARTRAPQAEFRVGSLVSVELPECVAVTAIGEVLSYALDERNDSAARGQLFRHALERLSPGGVLMFDVAGLDRAAPGTHRTFAEGPDWTVLVETELDATRRVLTRRITSFREVAGTYRRDAETHRLLLTDPAELWQSLRSLGFHVQRVAGYGPEPLPAGVAGFLCRKPGIPDQEIP